MNSYGQSRIAIVEVSGAELQQSTSAAARVFKRLLSSFAIESLVEISPLDKHQEVRSSSSNARSCNPSSISACVYVRLVRFFRNSIKIFN
jgi:hypothetical protein